MAAIPLVVTKSFSPASIPVAGISTLTITIQNPNPIVITGISFTDNYPVFGIVTANPNALTINGGIGGIVSAPSGGHFVSLSGGSLGAVGSGFDTYTITVNVGGVTPGTYLNDTGLVTSNEALPSSANAIIIVTTCPVITVFPPTIPNGTVGIAYGPIPIGSTGGTLPVTFSPQGILFPGVSLTGAIITGIPTLAGTFSFTLTATDANGCMGTQDYLVTISSAIVPKKRKRKKKGAIPFAQCMITGDGRIICPPNINYPNGNNYIGKDEYGNDIYKM